MSSKIKDRVMDAGQAVADTAKNVGNKIVEGAEQAAEWVEDKAGFGYKANIRERMDVIASCGKKVGVVDHVEGNTIKLTKNDSPDGQHHYIPVDWVERVDSRVHLKMNSMETEKGWKPDAASCGCNA